MFLLFSNSPGRLLFLRTQKPLILFSAVLALLAVVCWPAHLPAADLDQESLKVSIQQRVLAAAGKEVGLDEISLEMIKPVSVHDLELFGVKAVVNIEGEDVTMYLLVDAPGKRHFSDIQDLATGKSLVEEVMQKVSYEEPKEISMKGWGEPLFVGRGKANVVLVSDPFCPHCRTAWHYVRDNREIIRELVFVHMPLSPVSMTVVQVMKHAKSIPGVDETAAIEFAYSLPRIQSDNPELDIVNMAWKEFPALREGFSEPDSYLEYLRSNYLQEVNAMLQKAVGSGIKGTPAFIIDGKLISGFNRDAVEEALGY